MQPERTRLAWRRTALAFVVALLLAWRSALMSDTPLTAAGSVTALTLVWVGFLALMGHRTRALRDRPPAPLPQAAVVGVGLSLLACCGSALALIVLR